MEWLNDGKSFADVEEEEIGKIKSAMMSSTLEGLRQEYASARKAYPHREKELLKIAEERKLLLQDGGIH